jgi:hypothetical protein
MAYIVTDTRQSRSLEKKYFFVNFPENTPNRKAVKDAAASLFSWQSRLSSVFSAPQLPKMHRHFSAL